MIDLDIEAIVAPYRQALRPEGDPVAFTIPNVPASITRQQIIDWLAILGLDAAEVPRSTTFELYHDSIQVEVYARRADGSYISRGDRGLAALHRVVIPIEPHETEQRPDIGSRTGAHDRRADGS